MGTPSQPGPPYRRPRRTHRIRPARSSPRRHSDRHGNRRASWTGEQHNENQDAEGLPAVTQPEVRRGGSPSARTSNRCRRILVPEKRSRSCAGRLSGGTWRQDTLHPRRRWFEVDVPRRAVQVSHALYDSGPRLVGLDSLTVRAMEAAIVPPPARRGALSRNGPDVGTLDGSIAATRARRNQGHVAVHSSSCQNHAYGMTVPSQSRRAVRPSRSFVMLAHGAPSKSESHPRSLRLGPSGMSARSIGPSRPATVGQTCTLPGSISPAMASGSFVNRVALVAILHDPSRKSPPNAGWCAPWCREKELGTAESMDDREDIRSPSRIDRHFKLRTLERQHASLHRLSLIRVDPGLRSQAR